MSGAIAAATVGKYDVRCAALSPAEARYYFVFWRNWVMVTCRWQVRLAFLCVASWLFPCRDLRGVAVVFLFLAVVFRGVLV